MPSPTILDRSQALSRAVLELRRPGGAPATSNSGSKRLRSDRLLDGQREIIIEHAGCEYRLRRTMNDKLILTK